MPVLYLTEQGSIVRKTSDRLIVEKDHEVLLEVPCLKLDTVLIFGNVQVTTQALAEMLDHGIELAFLSRSGRLRGQLTPPKAKNLRLRMSQYEASRSEAFGLRLARTIVAAKIGNAAAVLRGFRRNHPEAVSREEIHDLEAAGASVESAGSLESLLGVEGAAAVRYFHCLGRRVPAEMGFTGRNRRPPRDPFNALLSFGYVLVGQELQSLLDAMGFDPYLGVYHQVDYGRPSLALDLLEEFRAPLVDRLSATLVSTGVLKQGTSWARPKEASNWSTRR
jgi:CRISPR-associated protein Cas1